MAMLLTCSLVSPLGASGQTPGKLTIGSPLKGIVGDNSRVDIGRHPLSGAELQARLYGGQQTEQQTHATQAKHSLRKAEKLTATIPYTVSVSALPYFSLA